MAETVNNLSNIELACNVTDLAACLFIVLIIIAAAVQNWNRNIHHFLSGLVLLLNGVCCHVMVRALEFARRTDGGPAAIPGGEGGAPGPPPGGGDLSVSGSLLDGIKHAISMITAPGNADTLVRVICFIFIIVSINEFFLQAISVRGPMSRKRSDRYRDVFLKTAIIAAGIVIYLVTDHDEVLTAIVMVYLLVGLYSIIKSGAFVLRRIPVFLSVLLPAFACLLTLVVPVLRLTGIALTIMYVVLYIEFHTYVETQLSAREAELAESRIRLMNEQISSHFTFNSLKIIEDMCKTDPAKAGQTINAFSKYLRSNLENITAAGAIPFEDELEHTKQYIELEQMEGSSAFRVQYDIGVGDFEVPPLVLEPLVENAIKHGVKGCGADTITLTTSEKDGHILISVSDNGKVRAQTAQGVAKNRRSIALENIRNRLALQYEGTLDVDYTENGTTATISIPLS